MSAPQVFFLFNRPRGERAREREAGGWPDEGFYALHTLRSKGFDARFSDAGFEKTAANRVLKALDNRLSSGGRRVGFHMAQAWTLRKDLAAADLIFATADSAALAALALKDLGLVKTPLVYGSIGLVESFHDMKEWLPRYYRRLLSHAHCVIYYGHAEGEALHRVFGVPQDRLRFVPLGIETAFFAANEARNEPPLAIGLDPQRDWPLLFEAVRRADTQIDLVCNRDHLKGLEIPTQIRVLDPVPMAQLASKMARAQFVVLPVRQNRYTAATFTLLECMAAGCAVIVTATAAVEHGYSLEHGKNCVLVPPGEVEPLAQAIVDLRSDARRAGEIGAEARRTVRSAHDIRHLADRYAEIFGEVLR